MVNGVHIVTLSEVTKLVTHLATNQYRLRQRFAWHVKYILKAQKGKKKKKRKKERKKTTHTHTHTHTHTNIPSMYLSL